MLPLTARSAEMSTGETYATDGGQMPGAANACGFDPEEIAIAIKQVMDTARQRAVNRKEMGAAQSEFAEGLKSGVEAIRSGQINCIDARDLIASLRNGSGGNSAGWKADVQRQAKQDHEPTDDRLHCQPLTEENSAPHHARDGHQQSERRHLVDAIAYAGSDRSER